MLESVSVSRDASEVVAQVPEISVVLAVGNVEDRVGLLVRSLAAQLTELNRSFELIAVNDGCQDNSLAVLRLLAEQLPQLRIVARAGAGRTYVRGATEAGGSILVLIDTQRAGSVASLGWALDRLGVGREAVVVRGSFIAARKLIALPAIVRAGGPSPLHERLFERAAGQLGLDVTGSVRPRSSGVLGSVLRFLAA